LLLQNRSEAKETNQIIAKEKRDNNNKTEKLITGTVITNETKLIYLADIFNKQER